MEMEGSKVNFVLNNGFTNQSRRVRAALAEGAAPREHGNVNHGRAGFNLGMYLNAETWLATRSIGNVIHVYCWPCLLFSLKKSPWTDPQG